MQILSQNSTKFIDMNGLILNAYEKILKLQKTWPLKIRQKLILSKNLVNKYALSDVCMIYIAIYLYMYIM